VKATAGIPAASACSQLRLMDAAGGASHDHSLCTWLSGGSTLPLCHARGAGPRGDDPRNPGQTPREPLGGPDYVTILAGGVWPR